jgi:hypothetical protein
LVRKITKIKAFCSFVLLLTIPVVMNVTDTNHFQYISDAYVVTKCIYYFTHTLHGRFLLEELIFH